MLKNLKLNKQKPAQQETPATQDPVELEPTTTENQPETEQVIAESQPAAGSSQPYSTEHFDDLIGQQEEVEQEAETQQAQQNMIGGEDFHALFCVSFSTASHLTGLKSLHVEKDDGAAKACTQALYETISDIPALHFLLMPQNKWLERVFAIGAFTVPMARAVSHELKAKAVKKTQGKAQNSNKSDDPPIMTLREMAHE